MNNQFNKTISQRICWGENLFVLRPCHDLAVAHSLDDLNHDARALCNGQRNFNSKYLGFGQPQQADDFQDFVKGLNGKENTYILLGVGKCAYILLGVGECTYILLGVGERKLKVQNKHFIIHALFHLSV